MRGFPAIQIAVYLVSTPTNRNTCLERVSSNRISGYLVIKPHLRTATLAWSDPLSKQATPIGNLTEEGWVLRKVGARSKFTGGAAQTGGFRLVPRLDIKFHSTSIKERKFWKP